MATRPGLWLRPGWARWVPDAQIGAEPLAEVLGALDVVAEPAVACDRAHPLDPARHNVRTAQSFRSNADAGAPGVRPPLAGASWTRRKLASG